MVQMLLGDGALALSNAIGGGSIRGDDLQSTKAVLSSMVPYK